MFRHRGSVSPIPQSGLSLWLKADAGVSKLSYGYAFQIVISGTSTPSFNGTYTAIGTPGYTNGIVDSYSFSAPSGKQMSWSAEAERYELFLSGFGSGGFQSSDGIDWTPLEQYISSIIITGFTGIYSGANGTYNATEPNSGRWDRVGGGFFIDGDGLRDVEFENLIATPPQNYSGSWTATSYDSSVTLTGAGTTSANGTYTRSDTDIDLRTVPFTASGGRSIDYSSGDWYVNPDSVYNNTTNLRGTWTILNGDSPAPSSSVVQSAKSVGSPTSTSVIVPSGSISGSVTTSTANTDYVASWADQSGNNRNVAQNAGYANTSTFEGKSFISFPDNTFLTSYNGIWPSTSTIDYGTIIIVARFPSSYQGFSSLLFNHGNLYIGRGNYETYPNGLLASKDNDVNIFGNSNLSNNTNYLIGMTFNLDSLNLYLNGTSNGSGANFENNGSDEFTIGFNGEPFSMAEIVVYNRVLTAQERQQVEAYLNTKYAIY